MPVPSSEPRPSEEDHRGLPETAGQSIQIGAVRIHRRRFHIGLGAAGVLVAVAIVVAVLSGAAASAGSGDVVTVSDPADPVSVEDAGSGRPPLIVHVLGAVRVPGLYELDDGARLVDAVAAAGGAAPDADTAAVNLARPVGDGEQIVVPRIGEAPPAAAQGSGGGPVSLNSATLEQLDSLPRLGPAMAARIIEWRELGNRFTAVDDLLEISGFGDKTVDGLRDLVVP